MEDFRHCVTQLSDVIGSGNDVSSRSTESLPQRVALSLANTLHYLLEEDVEMLARFLPDLRNLDISRIEMSQGLLGAVMSHFHLKPLYCTQGLHLLSSKQHISLLSAALPL